MEHFQSYVAKHATVHNDQFTAEIAYTADRNAKPGEGLRLSVALFDNPTYKQYHEATTDHQWSQHVPILLVKDILPANYVALLELLESAPITELAAFAQIDQDVCAVIPTPKEVPVNTAIAGTVPA